MIRALMASAFALAVAMTANASDTTHDVYVWQRQWTPALRDALIETRGDFSGVRVLVAQAGRDGRWLASEADPRAFVGDKRARVAVVRYDGAGAAPDVAKLNTYLTDLLARWKDGGAPIAAVEIDYDCGTARLADYASRLRALRKTLAPDVRLAITALPAWLDSSDLDVVLSAADEAVLQVHAVRNPSDGLFDSALAERWIRVFAPHAHNGFRVALPAYGMRVRFDAGGRAVAVESEMTVDATTTSDAKELRAEPADVVRLLTHLAADPPPNWRGIAWFRLPLPGDKRAWTIAALRDVIAGHVPESRLGVDVVASGNGASDLFVVNDGAADAKAFPLRITGSACVAGDAARGWHGEAVADGWRFVPDADLRIRAGTRRAVGWVRCAGAAHARVE